MLAEDRESSESLHEKAPSLRRKLHSSAAADGNPAAAAATSSPLDAGTLRALAPASGRCYGPAVSSQLSSCSPAALARQDGDAGRASSLMDAHTADDGSALAVAAALIDGSPFAEESLPLPPELRRGSTSHPQLGASHDRHMTVT